MSTGSAPWLSASMAIRSCTVIQRKTFLQSSRLQFSSRIPAGNFRRPSPSYIHKADYKLSCSPQKVGEVSDDESCELVNGVDLSIEDGDDSIDAHLFKAVKNNNGTGILLLSDIFGFQDSFTRDFAYRVACNGYNVLVPDLFRGDPWTKDRPQSLLDKWLSSQNPERVAKHIAMSTSWMIDEFLAAGISKKLGLIGFCFGGGRVIEVLAQDQASCFGAGVSFYGTRIDTTLAAIVRAPLLLIAGDKDPLCPASVLLDIEKIKKASKVLIFKGRGHGFVHRPQSPEEDEDAEQAFGIMRNWLHDGLIANKECLAV